MSQDQTSWVVLAHLLRPQGRKGELLAELLTDFPERFQSHTKAFLAPPGFDGPPSETRAVEIVSAWLPHGKNQGRIVLGFADINSIEQAERVAGLEIVIAASDRLPLTDEESYIDTLIGCTLYDHDVPIGVVKDVQFMTTPDGKRRLEQAAPLLTIDLAPGEALIPFAKEFLIRLDAPEKRLQMKLPEGLLDLNVERKSGPRSQPSEPQGETDR